jgi:hypothetical protein
MKQSDQIRADLGSKKFDFYRCYKCGKVITREEELMFYAWANEIPPGQEDEAVICDCGSMKIIPVKMSGDEWREKNVLRYSIKIILARGLIPWLEKKFPAALPWAEWLLDKELLSRYDWLAWQIVKRNIDE